MQKLRTKPCPIQYSAACTTTITGKSLTIPPPSPRDHRFLFADQPIPLPTRRIPEPLAAPNSAPIGRIRFSASIAGFQGFRPEGVLVVQPKTKPRGGELTLDEKAENSRISSIRIRVEHAISRGKRCRVAKDKLRNWRVGFRDLVMGPCCGLHDVRLNIHP
jgi:DDE superfamily endonuclease